MKTNSNNKIRKSNSKPKRPLTSKSQYRISPNTLATDESKKLYQRLNAYPNYKFIKQLSTEKLSLYLNNYTLSDINVISKILVKYFYFQQLTIGAFEPRAIQPQNPQSNNNQLNNNYQKNRNSKSLGKVYKNTKQKESDKIQFKQKIFSSLQKHLSQTKYLLSLVLQSFKINNELSKYISKGLSENKSLQYLSINYCALPLDIYEIILKGILNHEIIRCIDLSNNKLNDKYSPMISRIIQRQTQRRDQIIWSYQLRNELPNDNNYRIGLISINLHGNQLEKQSAEIITSALSSDQYIRYIDLSKNLFDNGACKLFVHMMRKNNILLTVDLRENSGYDEFINPRIVMKMSKNIKFLYSQYQNGQYTDEEFEYLKGFIDISFFDVDIPQEIVEYYNTNIQQTTDASSKNDNIIKNNLQNINNQKENINNSNNLNINIPNNINNNKVNNINNNVIINKNNEENKEEKSTTKNIKNNNNNNYNINKMNNNKNKNKNKNKNINNESKENSALKENQKLIQENLQLKQEILELKAKNLQKMLADGLVVPKEEEKDLENYYNRANEIIDTLNEVMAKLQQHKTSNNNNIITNQNDIKNLNLNEIKQNININKQNNNNIDNENENESNNNNEINNDMKNNNNENTNNNIQIIDINNNKNNDIDNNIDINYNNNIKNNNINIKNDNIENNNIIINNKINIDNELELDNKKDLIKQDKKGEIMSKNIEDKKEEKLNYNNNIKNEENIEIKNNKDDNNNMNISDDEENDFNFDDLSEEEKIALIQQREILMKLQEEAEARGEHFDIQEYLAQLEEHGDDEDDFGEQGENNNKLNKSF